MCIRLSEARRSSFILFRVHVFSLRSTENERSASALVTGKMHPISISIPLYLEIHLYQHVEDNGQEE